LPKPDSRGRIVTVGEIRKPIIVVDTKNGGIPDRLGRAFPELQEMGKETGTESRTMIITTHI
jgi:hypothetical protein